ncbi:hypothetical protein [Avibacterium paragallinarum]|uniref:hypothetical protein n=3 Tax=Avibacterium paragallinarum TaxID=728 RepID=UPI00021AD23C|nr:hypothetical protein [Avibacterium paragallinarum]QLD65280.1 hypothetical protein VY92_007985 [Avibacterium paragallinarum]
MSSGTKIGLSAIELGAAIGGTGLITKDSLGKFKLSNANANSKLPVVGKTENYENQTSKIHISSGAENVALYPKLKAELQKENLKNIVSKRPILEHSAFGYDNKTVEGTITSKEAEILGIDWVGDGATKTSQGGLLSADGTRLYRPPTTKKHSKYAITGVQANFERGHQDENGTFISESNLHINIEDKK